MSWSGERTPSQDPPRGDAEERDGVETRFAEPQSQQGDGIEATALSPESQGGDGTGTSGLETRSQQQEGEEASRPATSRVRPLLVEILQTVLLTLIIFAGVRSVVQNFKVDGASMEPTLHSGQYLLINKMAYFRLEGLPLELAEKAGLAPTNNGSSYFPFGGPQRGDIIVFRFPGTPDRDFIKRVIGLPGDTIQIDHGRVYRNGVLLEEDYIRAAPSYSLPAQKVPEGNYFVLGDNRPNSSDSHIWGFVPEENAIGKAWVSYWPPNQWGVLGNVGLANGAN